jgi:hypothetical protein
MNPNYATILLPNVANVIKMVENKPLDVKSGLPTEAGMNHLGLGRDYDSDVLVRTRGKGISAAHQEMAAT